MPLRWNVQDVENFKQVCFEGWNEEKESGKMKTITNALIWYTMIIGINSITEDNWEQVYSRIRFHEKLFGSIRYKETETGDYESVIEKDQVKDHIGLWTNASTLTAHKFKKSQIERWEQENGEF